MVSKKRTELEDYVIVIVEKHQLLKKHLPNIYKRLTTDILHNTVYIRERLEIRIKLSSYLRIPNGWIHGKSTKV